MSTLANNQVDIWVCQARLWFEYYWQENKQIFLDSLSTQEQNRAMRFVNTRHQERFIVFHGFMRQVLAQYLGVKPSALVFKKGEYGKPCLAHHADNVQFNLSHTHDVALLAVTTKNELGIDIEHRQRKTDWQGIARRFLTKSEQQALFALNKTEQQAAFFDLWTRKEAYIKAIGSGLALSPTQFNLTVAPEAPALLAHYADKFKPEQEINFKTILLPDELSEYYATLAVQGKAGEVALKHYFPLRLNYKGDS